MQLVLSTLLVSRKENVRCSELATSLHRGEGNYQDNIVGVLGLRQEAETVVGQMRSKLLNQ